ncbi:MBL fold metallo-hydrolase [Peterkaempfera sp. SMS 1(5)a]|uniref:MBL fold metallo-hydrolase n=1 Tax=Peterkaempfera podocarpi TaxID=3232308 RepID=UPI0036735ACB
MCFWDARNRLLLAGDQVLPRTVVAVHEPQGPHDDPLGGYLDSLDRLEGLHPDEVLPAHEQRFTDLPARLAELRSHHLARIEAAVQALRAGPATAWEIAGRLSRRGTLEGLRGFALHVSVSRALALLARLRRLGLAEARPGPPTCWALVPFTGHDR